MNTTRVVVWYSDGAASACAARLAVLKYGTERVSVVKADTTDDEHPDNLRFRADVEAWIGTKVELIRSESFTGIDDVFERTRYMAGIAGARCTTELKKVPRYRFQESTDLHIFGYTVDERSRIDRFEGNNPELVCEWNLRDENLTKDDCYFLLDQAGIELPAMYGLGFDHNNCIGCVKATSAHYWARTRRRAKQSRDIGARLVRIEGERVFLDEIPSDFGDEGPDGEIECGPFCEMQPSLFAASITTPMEVAQ